MAATYTAQGTTYIPVIAAVQPAASNGVVTRTGILNLASGDSTGNFSGSAGITGILYASATPLGGNTQTVKVNNTANADGTLFPITSGVTFSTSATTGVVLNYVVISRT